MFSLQVVGDGNTPPIIELLQRFIFAPGLHRNRGFACSQNY